ncbi:MAG: hypothetical protein JWM62_3149 [Frankiales bacterium]|jgi:hypothetical protein|nr:hypothetical protein [Frankiales bacterium]
MTDPDKDLLVTSEGVDEGSAASTAEGPGSGATPAAGGRAVAEGEAPTPPVEVDTAQSRAARAADTGQQLQAGEG